MIYLIAALAGLAGAAVGYGLVILTGDWLTAVLQIPQREGGAGLFLAFVAGPIAAIALALVAIVAALLWGGVRGFGPVAWRTALVFLALLVAAPGSVLLYPLIFPSEHLQSNGPEPLLEMEVRLPRGAFLPADRSLIRVQLAEKNTRDADFDPETWRREEEDGRVVIAASTLMFFRTSSRLVVLRVPLQADRLWRLKLAADPRGATEWSPWRPVDEVFNPGATTSRPAKPEEAAELRVRVFPR